MHHDTAMALGVLCLIDVDSKFIQKVFVRSGIRTHAHIRGPEHPLAFAGKVIP